MLAARRSLLASTAAAAASRRRSVWWSSVAPARRWLATVSAGDNDGADNAAKLTDKKRETPGQKNAREFALLPKLLQTFEDAAGHLIVPYHFVIPHADASIVSKAGNKPNWVFGRVSDMHQIPWSDDARGISFGRVLHKFANNPKHQKMYAQVTNALREMGLPLGEAYRKLAWDEQIMAALRTFYQIHKHSLVPRAFQVPRGDAEWPVATWGLNLGVRVNHLRRSEHELSTEELADLESVEFSFTTSETRAQKKGREFALLPQLLQTFRDATGHFIVPYRFVIPHADATIVTKETKRPTLVFGRVSDVRDFQWSEKARGVDFGRVLHSFAMNPKRQEKHLEVTNSLREMGLPLGEAYRKLAWDEQIMAALRTFYQIHKHALVPILFEVPRGDARWPVATWGFNLGRRVDTLRQNRHRLSDSELADLESVEFSFNAWETVWSEQVLPSIETYAQVHGNCRIPKAFQVPHEDLWPRKAWGLKLGSVVVDSIRREVSYASQVQRDMARLEAIRFVWDDSEYHWSEKVLPSLEVFHQFYGHSRVPQSFVVPSESPWPTEAWGLKLGVSVRTIRSLGTFAKQTERDATRLDAIGFGGGGGGAT